MGVPALVPLIARNGSSRTSPDFRGGRPTVEPKRGQAPSGFKWIPSPDSMVGVRAGKENPGISGKVEALLTCSRSTGTRYNYDSSWKKFCGWCDRRKINPFQSPVESVLEFLADLFDQGLKYRTINNYRSAISAKHEMVEGKPVGEHRDVCRLMKGINNERPPEPRYCSTWDITTALDYVKSLGENQALSDKNISLKLSLLLAITSAHRGAKLRQLKVNLMNLHEEFVDFSLAGKLKTSKQGKRNLASRFHQFTDDQWVCLLACLRIYLDRTREWPYDMKTILSFWNSYF